MPDFRWKDNQANTGTVRASDRREALRSLASRGIEPNELIEDKSSASPKRSGSPEAASDLISRLKPLLKSGLTAGEALRTLSKRSADPKTASLAKEIWQETASAFRCMRASAPNAASRRTPPHCCGPARLPATSRPPSNHSTP